MLRLEETVLAEVRGDEEPPHWDVNEFLTPRCSCSDCNWKRNGGSAELGREGLHRDRWQ